MLSDWFDERFTAAGARSFLFSPLRLGVAGVVWGVLAIGVGWPTASLWAACAAVVEWPFRAATKPMCAGRP